MRRFLFPAYLLVVGIITVVDAVMTPGEQFVQSFAGGILIGAGLVMGYEEIR